MRVWITSSTSLAAFVTTVRTIKLENSLYTAYQAKRCITTQNPHTRTNIEKVVFQIGPHTILGPFYLAPRVQTDVPRGHQ